MGLRADSAFPSRCPGVGLRKYTFGIQGITGVRGSHDSSLTMKCIGRSWGSVGREGSSLEVGQIPMRRVWGEVRERKRS